jgi:uncharacterized protein
MQPGRVLLVFALAVFVGGAVLAPWLYWLAQWGAAHYPALQSLAHHPFHRYVNRSLLFLALFGLWPLMRGLGLPSWKQLRAAPRSRQTTGTDAGAGASRGFASSFLLPGWAMLQALGWTKPRGQGGRLAGGFLVGLISLAVVALVALLSGAWKIRFAMFSFQDLKAPAALGRALLGAALSGLVVAVLEETLFRGAIMGALRRRHSATTAVVLSSAIYAWLHFFQTPAPPTTVHWFSGLALLPQMMRGFIDWQTLVPGFFNLTLVGIILGWAYERTGNLYFSIGVHGGWVFWLKSWGEVARVQPGANRWLWGSHKLIDGWLALVVLGLVLVILLRTVLSKERCEDVARLEGRAARLG